MHTCPLVSVFNEYIYIRYGRKIGFSWMYDWCWHSQVVANNLIVKSVQKMTFCHAEFGRNGAEKNPFFAIIRISINGFSRKKTYNQEKTTHIFHTKQWILEKKNMVTSNLAFSIQPKEKRAPPSQHTLKISPMEVGSSKALCLATIPELAPDLHMACDPCHDSFSCFRFSADGDFVVWFQKKLKVGLKERGLLVQSFFSLLLVVVAHQL